MKIKRYILFIIVIIIGLASTTCEGPVGPQGPQGEQGPPGPVGPAGTDGSIILAGQGAPDENTGKPGDFYLDLATGNLYGPKMAEGWGTPTNLQGPEGPQGPAGPEGPQGPPGEDGEDGQDGQDGQDGEDGEDGQDGEDGKDGQDGSQIYAGNGPPDSGLGKKGDYYLDRDDYDLYGPKTGNGWGSPINLQGPKGDQGPAGTTDHGMQDGLGDDDHLQYLLVDGVRDAADGFAVTGTFGSGMIPVEGEGIRLMWYPGKAAFRAGIVSSTQWSDANIGTASTAMGSNTIASGNRSTALGSRTTASGAFSTAMGSNTIASGDESAALGLGTIAATRRSLSIGQLNSANIIADNTLFVVGNGSSAVARSDALVLKNDGDMTIAGTLTENSDRRLKTGIQPLKEGALEKLYAIHPVRYHFKDSTRHPAGEQLGLIAQEVQAQFPELVSIGSSGYLSLSYSKFTSVLLKGMQEQQDEIKRLQSENVKIMERLAKLEQQRGIYTTSLPALKKVNNDNSLWIFGGLMFLGLVLCMNRRLPITYFDRNK